jgi:DNA-binding LacI/PurR family transcriptional regulator
MPLFELGEAATKLLIDVINGKDFAPLQRVQSPVPRVIERRSLAPPSSGLASGQRAAVHRASAG